MILSKLFYFLYRLKYGRVYASSKWSRVRKRHLKYEPRCAVCGTIKNLDVHHIIPMHIDPSRRYDPDNLITLCRKHHYEWGHLNNWRRWNPLIRQQVEEIKEMKEDAYNAYLQDTIIRGVKAYSIEDEYEPFKNIDKRVVWWMIWINGLLLLDEFLKEGYLINISDFLKPFTHENLMLINTIAGLTLIVKDLVSKHGESKNRK